MPDTRPKLLATLGLVAGILGLVSLIVPIFALFAVVPLVAGMLLGLIALISRRQGGKGLAIGAVVTSGLGMLAGVAMVIFAVIAFATALATSGPDAGPPPAIEEEAPDAYVPDAAPEDAVVSAASFGVTTFDDEMWWFVAEIENPNTEYVFDYLAIGIDAVDAAGTVVAEASEVATLLPGKSVVSGYIFTEGPVEIADLQFILPPPDAATGVPADEIGGLQVGELAIESDGYTTTASGVVSGAVSDLLQTQMDYTRVTVIARAADGTVIGAESGYVDPVSEEQATFEVLFFDPLPADAVFEAYAMP